MKGICYHPVRKGETIPDGLITTHPTADDLAVIENDFNMLHQAGFNTIRTYEPIVDPKILQLLKQYQLRVIVPICASRMKYDDLAGIKKIIQELKEEPSTLFWEIGNEWNFNHFYTDILYSSSSPDQLSAQDCYDIIKNISSLIRTSDDHRHPIGTDIMLLEAEIPHIYSLITADLDEWVDLYGVNIYDGKSFGDRFERWEKITQKPFYLGEFGAVAYNEDTKQEDPESQKVADVSLFTEILNNTSAKNPQNILIGGCLFEFCDEWWKKPEGGLSSHDTGGIYIDHGPFPSNCFDEEYFGMFEIDRQPRAVYFGLKELFKNS
jgi:hypothetical protein